MSDPISFPDIAQDVKTEIEFETDVQEESQVIVHCNFLANSPGDGYRIWPTTYLVDQHTGARSKLVHAENVCMHPNWQFAQKAGWHNFTLIFEALPRDCTLFDLIEDIPESGAFQSPGIRRNNSDVYNVDL